MFRTYLFCKQAASLLFPQSPNSIDGQTCLFMVFSDHPLVQFRSVVLTTEKNIFFLRSLFFSDKVKRRA